MERIVRNFDQFLEGLSRYGIIICLFIILTFAVLSIVFRWMGISPLWIEPMIRHMVFLSAFLGGSLATSKRVHIKVDLLTHLIDRTSNGVIRWLHRNIISLFCFVTTLVLTKAAYDFYLVEKEFGTHSFLDIHSSVLVGIIPVGMGLICLRFLNQLLLGIMKGEGSERHSL